MSVPVLTDIDINVVTTENKVSITAMNTKIKYEEELRRFDDMEEVIIENMNAMLRRLGVDPANRQQIREITVNFNGNRSSLEMMML